jgi:TPR repeat protein
MANPAPGKPVPSDKEYEQYFNESEKAYLKALEMKAEYFDAAFNLGALYFNRGVKQNDYANTITDNKKYEVEAKKADDIFNKSLPWLEKAEKIGSEEPATMKELYNTLAMLYRMTSQLDKEKEYKEKAKSAGSK